MKGIGVLGGVVLLAASAAEPALAHTGPDAPAAAVGGGLWSGLLHPVTGLDHMLAMVTVGLLAAGLGGRALRLVPAAFLAMMAAGGLAGMAGLALPYVELGIAASVVVLGLLVAARVGLPALAAAAVVGLFAVFHGHAHGAEAPVAAVPLAYALGFLLATALLHAAGASLGLLLGRAGAMPLARVGGGAVAAAGGMLLLIG